jgi:hypothetical protein
VSWREALALLPVAGSCFVMILAQSAATARAFPPGPKPPCIRLRRLCYVLRAYSLRVDLFRDHAEYAASSFPYGHPFDPDGNEP